LAAEIPPWTSCGRKIGGVKRDTGNVFLIPVERRDKETLPEAIKDWILPSTTIISDYWKVIIKTFIVEINYVLPLNNSLKFQLFRVITV